MSLRTTVLFSAASLAVVLSGCGERPADTQSRTTVRVESADAQGERMSSGRAEAPFIDPQRKAVTVVSPPSAPNLAAVQRTKLTDEQDRREGRIHQLMERYADNLQSPAGKGRYGDQIGEELEAYKRRTLELHKLQRQATVASTPQQAESPQP